MRTAHWLKGRSDSLSAAISTQREWPTADFATALADRDDPSRIAAAYDSGDGVHSSDAGPRALANAIDLTILAQDRSSHYSVHGY